LRQRHDLFAAIAPVQGNEAHALLRAAAGRRRHSEDVPLRRTDAGGAIGCGALDAGTVPSGRWRAAPSIKPGEPGEAAPPRSASRSMRATCQHQARRAGEALHREARSRSMRATCRAPRRCRGAAPRPMPVARSPRDCRHGGEPRQHQARRARRGAPPRQHSFEPPDVVRRAAIIRNEPVCNPALPCNPACSSLLFAAQGILV
jgi:hypothetical protein